MKNGLCERTPESAAREFERFVLDYIHTHHTEQVTESFQINNSSTGSYKREFRLTDLSFDEWFRLGAAYAAHR